MEMESYQHGVPSWIDQLRFEVALLQTGGIAW
jgi:hypothetical protein